MGKWTFVALLLVGVGVAYVLIKRPSVKPSSQPSTSSNAILNLVTSSISAGSKLISSFNTKPAPTSAVTSPDVGADQGTYNKDTSDLSVTGNTLTNDSGQAVTYGTD